MAKKKEKKAGKRMKKKELSKAVLDFFHAKQDEGDQPEIYFLGTEVNHSSAKNALHGYPVRSPG